MAKGFCRKEPESLTVVWERDRMGAGGCTDGKNIRINAAASARSGSREQKVLGMIGVAAHECGHINFSNFEKRRIYASGIREGILYPELPEPKMKRKTGTWGIAGMSGAEKEKELRVIRETLLYLHNILEDMYIEARQCAEYGGIVQKPSSSLEDGTWNRQKASGRCRNTGWTAFPS